MSAECAAHPTVEAAGTCDRCGRFACSACGRAEAGLFLCAECLARPEARLIASAESKRALVFALLGLHGLFFLVPMAFWLARTEVVAIENGHSPQAGKPWAQGALIVCALSAVTYGLLALWWLTTSGSN